MFTHIVMFKFKDKNFVEEAKNILLSMEGKIDELKYLEVGADVLDTERSFHIVLITKFDSKEDMDKYQVSEYHVNHVLKKLKPMIEKSVAVDY